MNFESVVRSRRTIYQFLADEVTLEQIMPSLTLSVLAPNHHLTQPWQFLWVGEQTKKQLADIYAHARANKQYAANNALHLDDLFTKAYQRFMKVPAILMVACKVGHDAIQNEEDFAATCCAINTFLLSLPNSGLGSQWSTHPMIKDGSVSSLLGLDPNETRLVAMIYIGKPAVVPPEPPRKNASDFLYVFP
jgi:nitroreductase